MTEQNQNQIPTPDGMAPSESGGGVGQENGQFISRSEFDAAMAEVKEQARRDAQSYSMQAESRINKRISSELESFENSLKLQEEMGAPMDPKLAEQARQRIISRAYAEDREKQGSQGKPNEEKPSQANIPQGGQSPDSGLTKEQAQAVTEMKGMAEMAGFTIEETDPEFQDLKPFLAAETSPAVVKREFAKALKVKGARLQTLRTAQNPNSISGGSVANPDLMKKYIEEKSKLPRGNIKVHHELRIKYLEQGLTGI